MTNLINVHEATTFHLKALCIKNTLFDVLRNWSNVEQVNWKLKNDDKILGIRFETVNVNVIRVETSVDMDRDHRDIDSLEYGRTSMSKFLMYRETLVDVELKSQRLLIYFCGWSWCRNFSHVTHSKEGFILPLQLREKKNVLELISALN